MWDEWADHREAQRRNAENWTARKAQSDQFVAEARRDGYEDEAADAIAARRMSQEGIPASKWTASDNKLERHLEQFKIDVAAGKLGRCPVCGYHAPVSQGVILGHEGKPDNEGYREGCSGVGMEAMPGS